MLNETKSKGKHKFSLKKFKEMRYWSLKKFYNSGLNLHNGATLAHELKHVEQHKETVPLAIKKVAEEIIFCSIYFKKIFYLKHTFSLYIGV